MLSRGVAVGVYPSGNGPLYGDFTELKQYIDLADGIRPRIISLFSPWRDSWGYRYPTTANLQTIYNLYPGSVVMWSWEPRGVTLAGINGGVHGGVRDAYIDQVAKSIKAVGRRVLIRFGHEMNGNGGWPRHAQPTNFRAAWRRIVSRFRRVGVTNAEWVWSPIIMYPNGGLDFRPYYPGDAYVDWTALDGYNWGTVRGDWRTFREVFRYSMGVIAALSPRGVIIVETGCHSRGPNGGSKDYWFRQTARELKQNYPHIKGFVYSHMVDERDGEDADWRVDSPAGALAGWRALVADPQLKATLVRP
ncbi:MAG: hypothetical protein H0U02_09090 [Rubrobacter sp.]|nr:hypothetical protein [Rubrobacter sp.]